MLDGLLDSGGTWVDFLETLPPALADREPRADDDKFRFVTGRRPMVEYVHDGCGDAACDRVSGDARRDVHGPDAAGRQRDVVGDAVGAPASDRPLKQLRHPEKFTKVVKACRCTPIGSTASRSAT